MMDAAMMKDRMWHSHGAHSPHYMAIPLVFATWMMGIVWGTFIGMILGKKMVFMKMQHGRGVQGMHHHHGWGKQACCEEHGPGRGWHQMSQSSGSSPQEEERDEGE